MAATLNATGVLKKGHRFRFDGPSPRVKVVGETYEGEEKMLVITLLDDAAFVKAGTQIDVYEDEIAWD